MLLHLPAGCWGSVFPFKGPLMERCKEKSNRVFISSCCILRFYMANLEMILLSQWGKALERGSAAVQGSSAARRDRTMHLGRCSLCVCKVIAWGFIPAIGLNWMNPFYICFNKLFDHLKNHYHLSESSWRQLLLGCEQDRLNSPHWFVNSVIYSTTLLWVPCIDTSVFNRIMERERRKGTKMKKTNYYFLGA